MTFDWPTHIRTQAAHLLMMARTPGWKEHAERRRDEMLADRTWDGLREELTRQQREATDAPRQQG